MVVGCGEWGPMGDGLMVWRGIGCEKTDAYGWNNYGKLKVFCEK